MSFWPGNFFLPAYLHSIQGALQYTAAPSPIDHISDISTYPGAAPHLAVLHLHCTNPGTGHIQLFREQPPRPSPTMPDSQIDLFWSSLFIQTVMKYIWYNHQPVPHVCRQTANKNARKLRVSEFVSSCGPLVSLVSWGGDEVSSDSWCDWLSTEMPLYIMSCIFTMLQGLTRAVTCLLLLLSIKMYPQLGEQRRL